MAQDSQRAALHLQTQGRFRSCASRVYYAAFQAVTAVLLYRGCAPPALREAWSHEDTPGLIVDQWGPVLPSLDRRQDLERRLKTLYKLRVSADYIGEDIVEASAIMKAIRDAGFLIKVADDILPEGENNAQ